VSLAIPDGIRDRLSDEVIDELLAGARTEEEIVGPGGVLAQLTKRLVERAMSAELSISATSRTRNRPAALATPVTARPRRRWRPSTGPLTYAPSVTGKGTFAPQIVRNGQRRFEGFDDKILALYSRGLSTRDIEAHLAEIDGVKVGRDLTSRVTDALMEDVREWQRPLDDVYPVSSSMRSSSRSAKAGRCSGAPVISRSASRWRGAGRSRDVVPEGRGRQVPDAGPQRAQAAPRLRHPPLLR
jgi:hypothetical protein